MRILITGATGLVGHSVMAALKGHELFGASRNPSARMPDGVTAVHWPGGDLPDVDAVIHLAGASIGGKRWTKEYQEEIRRSRVETTRQLVARYGPDTALVCASAVGYYGRNPDGPCDVTRGAGDDFLASVCRDWESEANGHDGRTVVVRFGHVLAAGEGLLGRIEPLHRLRAAGIIPPGTQLLPWVMATDLASMLATAATTPVSGTFNGVAGNVAYTHLHRALCDHIGGFKYLKIPALALKIRLGAFAPYLMGGQDAVPGQMAGWAPEWADINVALDHLYS